MVVRGLCVHFDCFKFTLHIFNRQCCSFSKFSCLIHFCVTKNLKIQPQINLMFTYYHIMTFRSKYKTNVFAYYKYNLY